MKNKKQFNIDYAATKLTGGFWSEKQALIRNTTIHSVYRRFAESGRVAAFSCDPAGADRVHYYWDSDVAKWLESVAYLTEQQRDAELEALADAIIDEIAAHQWEDGYINSYYTVRDPAGRFQKRKRHELYCAGHLIEAAVAYKRATGKDTLYRCMLRYADLIDRVFRVEKSAGFLTPGHQEIELALVKLYQASGEERYLQLAAYFTDARGDASERAMAGLTETPGETMFELPYAQDQAPVREMQSAEGHAVRLLYMCAAMADIALARRDSALRASCERLFYDMVERKMYITGGLGSNANHEGFDAPYCLPNAYAYNETCASIAMCLFAMRMQLLSDSSVYADVIERELYNGVLSGISLCGKKFFYENPLEIDLDARERLPGEKFKLYHPLSQRVELFWCSCCPPNLTRIIPTVANYMYTMDGEVLRVNQYMAGKTELAEMQLVQQTDYPRDGSVVFCYKGKPRRVGFRIPGWCHSYEIEQGGKAAVGALHNGYFYLSLSDGDCVTLHFDMTPVKVEANPHVKEDAWKIAVMRGPVVYCAEATDNPEIPLHAFRATGEIRTGEILDGFYFPSLYLAGEMRVAEDGAPLYRAGAYRRVPCELKLIPYHTFANRNECDMAVWLHQ